MNKKIQIEIPESLFKRIKNISEELGVKDINIFIIDLLRNAVADYEAELSKEEYTPEELEKIKDRLRSLGYLD
jgi:metal-responsive CopG/Arc/MetJ family transcriptional regulator